MSRSRIAFWSANVVAAIVVAIAFGMAAPMTGGTMVSGDGDGTSQTPPPPPPPPPATDGHIWIP